MKLLYNTSRDAYDLEDVRRTMTVGELIAHLQDYDPDTPVYLGFDNGYTYGSVQMDSVTEGEEDEDE